MLVYCLRLGENVARAELVMQNVNLTASSTARFLPSCFFGIKLVHYFVSSLCSSLQTPTDILSGRLHNYSSYVFQSRYTMTDASRPSEPLKILTLDGAGLQAISTFLILNKVLETIAQEKGVLGLRKPRPYDVFDTIAGIGVGGWLGILLGRFRMDIASCLSEWYNMMQRIAPRSMTEQLRLRLLRHCYFDTDRVVETVDPLTQFYGTGDRLFEPDPQGARTRHVFVAALTSDAKGYNLFRSYEIPTSAKLPGKLLEGPENPASFKI